jgi:glutathione S-transferase
MAPDPHVLDIVASERWGDTTPSRPRLITFAASHFCEKARWALDWHGIAYNEIGWPPGLHLMLAKRCGAKCSTLPILLDGDTIIQGSGTIIDWAESKAEDPGRSLNPRSASTEAEEIERRADEVIGVHVRRLAYAELLPKYAHVVKPALFYRASGWRRQVGNMMWPVVWRIMMRMYDIRPGAAAESRARLEAELDWLDGRLADGRTYLAGDRFSRADLTVASLLANFAKPKELPAQHGMKGPDALAADVERWSKRPVMRWVITQYRAHRTPASSLAARDHS